jgi:L-fuculokinase
MDEKLVIVFDCGATNARAVAVNAKGEIAAMHSLPNATSSDPFYPGGLIWDVEDIWQKFCTCSQAIIEKINSNNISAVTVTTFGVNGAPVDSNGKLLYPVISWQCQRTIPVMDNIEKYIPLVRLYQISGVNAFSFNTINTLIWLKENKPHHITDMKGFLFISSIFVNKLTGQLVNDVTMAGTSMLTDSNTRAFSREILSKIGIPDRFFKIEEAGNVVGRITKKASNETGLPADIPVVIAGHDTQFALIGSGAGENETVLSSGTWEILMTRTRNTELSKHTLKAGLTNEFDAVPGLFNTGIQWLASGVIEWIKNLLYREESISDKDKVYEIMIDEASKVDLKNTGIEFKPDLATYRGNISGLGIHTTRQQIYRAALEALVLKTYDSLTLLQQTGKFKAKSLIIVGGGAKNKLWNQLRANKLGIPVKIARHKETTVLGAAIFAHVATGSLKSINEGIDSVCRNYEYVYPE